MQQGFLLQILLLAQHVSGTTMPIIRSSRVLYSGISCCCFQVAGLVWSWGLCVRFAGCAGTEHESPCSNRTWSYNCSLPEMLVKKIIPLVGGHGYIFGQRYITDNEFISSVCRSEVSPKYHDTQNTLHGVNPISANNWEQTSWTPENLRLGDNFHGNYRRHL